jgi:hypothetical protein
VRRIRSFGVAVLLALATCVATATLFQTAAGAVSVPPGCGQPVVSSDSHSLTVRCTSGHGGRYKITADACNTSNCVSVVSILVAYGTTAKADGGGGYVTASSVTVYWYPASGGSACPYSKPGGAIKWCDMAPSITDWVNKHPSYSQTGTYLSNWYQDRTYRRDCSGLVSMAWHLNASPDTDALATSSYTNSIAKSSLRPGDILDDIASPNHDDHHVVIFAGWNSDHTAGTTNGTFKIWSFGYGTFADDSGHHELHDSFSTGLIAGKARGDYIARRYANATG